MEARTLAVRQTRKVPTAAVREFRDLHSAGERVTHIGCSQARASPQRELGVDICGGVAAFEPGTSVWSVRDDGSRLAAIIRTVAPKAAQISIFARVE